MKYQLLDTGNQQKLERFGEFLLIRPSSQAIWEPSSPLIWKKADAIFSREGKNFWTFLRKLPEHWIVELSELHFKISLTDFGHLGVFPEHASIWQWVALQIQKEKREHQVLNLFAYSGGATLAVAKAGAKVCHLDASKGMVAWAKENAILNGLQKAPIRWIVDDVIKFLKREVKRKVFYDGIILDPPSFGRGNQGEIFKFERDLPEILNLCRQLLTQKPSFVVLSSHTPGITPLVMHHLLTKMMKGAQGEIDSAEMVIQSETGLDLPSGSYAKWSCR